MEDPTSGSIIFNGVDIADMKVDINIHRQKMGMVFQHFNLFNNKTVIENIMLAPVYVEKKRMKKLRRNNPENEKIKSTKEIKADAQKQAMELLKRIGLEDKADAYPSQLSGGQKQRVALAGVLAMEPEVLVLDEPMAGLDPAARRDFLELIDRLHREGLTVVMVSHSMDDLANCCDRIVVMNEGAVFAEGAPAQVFAHADELKSIGLGVPAAQRMALALAEAGVPLRCAGLYTVESLADELADLLIGRSDGVSSAVGKAKFETVAREEGC